MERAIFDEAYQRIFAEGLKPYGFLPMKRGYVVVRVIDHEVLQFIYPKILSTTKAKWDRFYVNTTVRSVYNRGLCYTEIKGGPRLMYDLVDKADRDDNTWQKFDYIYSASTIDDVLRQALGETIELMIPVYAEMHSLLDFIAHCVLAYYPSLEFNVRDQDAAAWIAIKDQLDIEKLKDAMMRWIELYERRGILERMASDSINEEGQRISNQELLACTIMRVQNEYLDPLKEILGDEERCTQAEKDKERRKETALKFLKRNGIVV